ncbi:MAG: hypothetical protein KGK09_11110 [Burkholderiales bacterium]|nr:hypothetical protein [Burkholderiales bacterium]
MRSGTQSERLCSLDDLSPADVQGLLAVAARIGAPGVAGPALEGRHVVVVSEAPASTSAAALAAAAAALGAAVVRLRPDALQLEDRQRLRETARLLGRLYQLIGCDGLRPSAMAGLCRWAGVPVLGDVAGPCHPARMLGDLLAMQEHAGRPAAHITLGLADAPRSAVGRAWGRVSALTGLQLVSVGPAAAGRARSRCDFVLGPGPHDPPGAPSTLQVREAEGDARADLGLLQASARHRLLQSLLSSL